MPPQLTVSQLFQPAPSGVGPYGMIGGANVGAVPQTPGSGSWLATAYSIAATVQLPTTAWQPGGPERTILATEAVCFALSDAVISQMAQGSFLQSSASGTVLYTAPDGTQIVIPVTPDPSSAAQNPTGAPGYEDLLGQNVYGVTRLQASYASGPLAIAKLSAGTLTYAVGAYHVGNTLGGATYHNLLPLSIPSSVIGGSGGQIVGITPGVSTTSFGTASAHGLAVGQSVYINVPTSTGINGLGGVFALVTGVSSTTFQAAVASSGSYGSSGGNVYLCTVAEMAADVQGILSNAGVGNVTTAITQNTNVFVSNLIAWSGTNFESNLAYAGRCVLSLAAKSPNGPSQAYVYFAESAYQLLLAETPPYQLENGPVTASEFATPSTGTVTTVVASATPASTTLGQPVTPGVSQLGVTGVSSAAAAVVSCAGATGLTVGETFIVTISGVLGPTSVNGTFLGTYVSADSFSIPVATTSAPSYLGGGSVDGGDLGQIDQLLQANVVPDNTTAVTVSALALPIVVSATVSVPAAYVLQYTAAVATQLAAQIASYAVGGNAPDFEVAYDDIVGALEQAGVLALGQASYVRQISALSLNGQGTGLGVPFPSNLYQALLVSPSISVLGV